MRGTDEASGAVNCYVDLEERAQARHLPQLTCRIVNASPTRFDAEGAANYTDFGRPYIAPERLIRASQRWSRNLGPVVKEDRMMKVTIQNEETQEPFTRV